MGTPTCERCRTRVGTPYSFHYGRVRAGAVHPVTHRSGGAPRSTTTRRPTLGGTDAAYVCARCLRRARLGRAGRVLVRDFTGFPLLLIYALPVLGAGVAMGHGDWVASLLWTAVVVAVPVSMLALVYALMQPQATGERAAIELHRPALEAQGWEQFWTTREFARLHATLDT